MCLKKIRARRDEDKQQRHADILAAAARLFDTQPYATLRMDDVAREAGLAKGTLYLYFSSKEEVFLALQAQEIAAWMQASRALFSASATALAEDEFARLLVASLVQQPRLLKLLALLHTVLEQNASEQSILAFKQELHRQFALSGPLLAARLGFLAEDGPRLLFHVYALLIGLWQVAVPAPVVRKVLEENESLAAFRLDFSRELEFSVAALLRGWPKP